MKYLVTVSRTSSMHLTIPIEAENMEGATYKALDDCVNWDFNKEQNSEYEVIGIKKI